MFPLFFVVKPPFSCYNTSEKTCMQRLSNIGEATVDHRYKSWSDLNKQLNDRLCGVLKGRISYFLTRYHSVRNCYGRAAIRLDGTELAAFAWNNWQQQEFETGELFRSGVSCAEAERQLQPHWDEDCVLSEYDFLEAVSVFLRDLNIQDALKSDDQIIKILAILDGRVGKRTLEQIKQKGEYKRYPDWVRQFYDLRMECEGIA